MKPTDTQRDIIEHDGDTVVLAKPGTGKTFVISERIKRLLSTDEYKEFQGVIAISFTRKASQSLRERVLSNGTNKKNSYFGTIDSFCLTQVIIPFAKYIFGRPNQEVRVLCFKELEQEKQNSAFWLNDHPIYDNLEAEKWNVVKKLYSEGIFVLESLQILAIYILTQSEACKSYLRARYKSVFIDEFQDADANTYEILRLLMGLGMVGVVVGDINQSIFGFAKKDSKYLEAIANDLNVKRFELNDNFRCHLSIINYSNRLLDEKCQLLKCDDIRVFHCRVNGDEEKIANFLDASIPKIIEKEKYNIEHPSEIGVLTKSNEMAHLIKTHLSIPSRVFETTDLDIDFNLKSVLFTELLRFGFDERISFLGIIDNYLDIELLSKPYRSRLNKCKNNIRKLFSEGIQGKENEIVSAFNEVANLLLHNTEDKQSTQLLREVLANTNLLDTYKPINDKEVTIMTLHKSKGLEFKAVFHLELYEWVFPSKKPNNVDFNNPIYFDKKQDLDLHYVGVTRAKELCVLVTSTKRTKKNQIKNANDSEFLSINGLENLRKSFCYGS